MGLIFTIHYAHMYYIVLQSLERRTRVMEQMKNAGIHTVFHYVPLHDSPYGSTHGRACGSMAVTSEVADCLLRLPLWLGVEEHQQEIVEQLQACLAQ